MTRSRLFNPCVAVLLAILLGGCASGGASAGGAPLLDPASGAMNTRAPDRYRVVLVTSKGDVTIDVTRAWAPEGADRFYNLVRNGFYDGARFFRVLPGFIVQFGISGDPAIASVWRSATIDDDPPAESNSRGTLSFAAAGPDTRATQVFINLRGNPDLDGLRFTPFGRVVGGMEIVESFYSAYGEGAPNGPGPDQLRMYSEGNAYLQQAFPMLDYITETRVSRLN